MRIVLQRVRSASVRIDREVIASIDRGLLLLVGIGKEDADLDLHRVARKIAELRIFEDDEGKMNRALKDVGGEVLAVSQFTLYGRTEKGRRPSFIDAAPPEVAAPLFAAFVEALAGEGVSVAAGRFGARMAVELINDGPVTLILDLESGLNGG